MDPYLWCWWHGFAQFCWVSPLTLKYAKQKVFTNYKQWEDLHTHDRACMCRFRAATTYSTSTQNDSKILYPHPSHAWPLFVMFEWNALLNLSDGAATKTLSSLKMELLLQVLGESTRTVTVWMIRGDEGMGDIPGVRGVQGESAGSAQLKLDWHKNSDLGSEVSIGTGLNSTTCHLIESMALLTKLIGIVTPLILSIVVVVAPRLISYRKDKNKPWDHIVHVELARSYHTWASMSGGDGKINDAVRCICMLSEVRSKCNNRQVY